jgi:O6-methylguanine-DNA--protein-cysteine methyltransferase
MKVRTTVLPPAQVSWGIASSPAGKLAIGLTDKGEICRLAFLRGRKATEAVAEWQSEWPQTEFKRGAAVEIFSRKPILLVGTAFQHSVWQVIARIPAGSVTT